MMLVMFIVSFHSVVNRTAAGSNNCTGCSVIRVEARQLPFKLIAGGSPVDRLLVLLQSSNSTANS
jgi:hypothetical protein